MAECVGLKLKTDSPAGIRSKLPVYRQRAIGLALVIVVVGAIFILFRPWIAPDEETGDYGDCMHATILAMSELRRSGSEAMSVRFGETADYMRGKQLDHYFAGRNWEEFWAGFNISMKKHETSDRKFTELNHAAIVQKCARFYPDGRL